MTISMYKDFGADFRAVPRPRNPAASTRQWRISEAKQLDPNFFLNMRLYPDMYH